VSLGVDDQDVTATPVTGSELQRLRDFHGLYQTAVARQVGIAPSYLCKLERGQVPLTPEMAARIRRGIVAVIDQRAVKALRLFSAAAV
jgi:transcriptional regulator with XRE-family HTH domain